MRYLGIDLGGINIAAAVVSEAGEILGRGNIPTPRAREAVADTMAAAARLAAEQAGVSWGGTGRCGNRLSGAPLIPSGGRPVLEQPGL